jgi:hypothetical protein
MAIHRTPNDEIVMRTVTLPYGLPISDFCPYGGHMTVRTPSPASTPVHRTGWPVLRTPKWMLATAAILVAGLVVFAWPTHPSTAQRVADLKSMVSELTTDIESCAGGITDTATALRDLQDGSSADIGTGQNIATTAVNNCSPANNMQLDDLTQYQVPNSLAQFHFDTAVQDLVTWAFPLAQRVQSDMGTLMTAKGAAVATDTAKLRADEKALDAERATFDKFFTVADKTLNAHVAPPPLPG